ncbi:TetR/AcrR family transcriptional regulator [Paenibacillus sp. FSL R7-0048]|uniref:TetR family transcriptional regulator n=1 Tax=Paenibacillus odorifer TaxID=189426 RepID=A0A1R0YTW3_9BACL|nr:MULTISPECIES: TetR/AcrR family transcriptional regulator [Paenibacillus]AWV32006.1 TetR family transcriptional regulator [Paenibacillus odorifer]MDH6446424.1 TetR/AcrR family transcriptional regulator of autoinduction and epiphytic fitness [Paenibacillus sp. PastF-4]OMC66907.1 TetR family transcriptional regulator [Paenibacillus odorifer]OMC79403.1 TetR family transcriptional regulator [Paenibacillus odorifer]OMD36257.1 TetR family transcriptional regulator [Paenibacillus odorifer]
MAVVDRRQQVLQAAAKSFSLFGYKATTMDQVAKIANVGKGTIYTFFTNKEQLFDEILRDMMMEMKTIAEREIRRDRPFFDNLHRVLDALLEFRSEQELFIKLSQENREFGTPQAGEGLEKIENVVLEYLEREVQQALQQGEIKPCDPKIVSVVMFRLYIVLTAELNKTHTPLDKEQIKMYFHLFLAEGLAQ